MERLGILACAASILWLTLAFPAQRSADTRLQVVVEPDGIVEPQQITLHFRRDTDPTRNVLEHTELVTAKFRVRPGASVRLLARPISLTGPHGEIDLAALSWKGTAATFVRTTNAFNCTSGTFDEEGVGELADIQTRAGVMACLVTFSLNNMERLPAGVYSGSVALSLRLE